MPNMHPGGTYLVTFLYEAGNYRTVKKEMRGVYLGYDPVLDEHEFSLRPVAGTTGVRAKNILQVEAATGEPFLPRKVM